MAWQSKERGTLMGQEEDMALTGALSLEQRIIIMIHRIGVTTVLSTIMDSQITLISGGGSTLIPTTTAHGIDPLGKMQVSRNLFAKIIVPKRSRRARNVVKMLLCAVISSKRAMASAMTTLIGIGTEVLEVLSVGIKKLIWLGPNHFDDDRSSKKHRVSVGILLQDSK